MDRERWERIQAMFHNSVDLSPEARGEFLEAACGGDGDLMTEVLRLIDEDARGVPLLDRNYAAVAGQLFGEPDRPVPLRQLGPYRIVRVLGEGGMGVVYLAERVDLGTRVAIKVLRDAWVSPTRRARFAIEQRMLARLNHPFIARLYDAGTLDDGTPWFVMEYVEGVPLCQYCDEARHSLQERLRLFRDVCEAVQHAHQHLVVHRDLKPSNILVTTDGRVKLLDFGVAKQLDPLEAPADQARTILRWMTPAYAAPEQVRGEPPGIHTDVYSLGVILYELLTTRRPFDLTDRTPAEAARIVVEETPPKPSTAAPNRPALAGKAAWKDLDVLCLTAMHRDVPQRYATVDALRGDVERFLTGEPLAARPASTRYRAGKFLHRHWRGLSAAMATMAIIIALVAFYANRLTTARNAAIEEAGRTQRIQRFMLSLFDGGEHAAAPADSLRVITLIDRGVQQARALDTEPAVQAELFHTLGTLYGKLGRFDRADGLLQAALDRRRALFGAAHPDVAESLVALGELRVDQARVEDGERLVREGMDMIGRALPPDHPDVARARVALGKVLEERGAYTDAIPLFEASINVYSGSRDAIPDLADSLMHLANVHFYAGHLDESESLNRRLLGMYRQLYGSEHPLIADALINLGNIESNRGRYGEAAALHRQALEIIRPWYGDDHPETASAMTILAQALVYQKKFDEAVPLLREALAIQEQTYGSVHPRVAFALNEVGSASLQRRALDEAEASFDRVVSIYRRVYGKHYRLGVAVSNLASVYLAREQFTRAEQLYREALAIFADTLPADHLNSAVAQVKLGRALVRQQRYGEAEGYLLNGYRLLTAQSSPTVSWLQTARQDLVSTYEALQRPEEARKFRAELAPRGPAEAGPHGQG